MDKMHKSDKTMAELELDQNLKLDLSRVIGGGGEEMKALLGAGFVGLKVCNCMFNCIHMCMCVVVYRYVCKCVCKYV